MRRLTKIINDEINVQLMIINVPPARPARQSLNVLNVFNVLLLNNHSCFFFYNETTLNVTHRFSTSCCVSKERPNLSHWHFAMQPRHLAPTDEQRNATRSHVL